VNQAIIQIWTSLLAGDLNAVAAGWRAAVDRQP
jgi:hypothetical protein